MERAGLMYDGANTMRLDYAPDEESDACSGGDDCLEREQVAASGKSGLG